MNIICLKIVDPGWKNRHLSGWTIRNSSLFRLLLLLFNKRRYFLPRRTCRILYKTEHFHIFTTKTINFHRTFQVQNRHFYIPRPPGLPPAPVSFRGFQQPSSWNETETAALLADYRRNTTDVIGIRGKNPQTQYPQRPSLSLALIPPWFLSRVVSRWFYCVIYNFIWWERSCVEISILWFFAMEFSYIVFDAFVESVI